MLATPTLVSMDHILVAADMVLYNTASEIFIYFEILNNSLLFYLI